MSPAAFEALDCLCLPLLLRHETRHSRQGRPEKTRVLGKHTGVLQDPGTHRPAHSQGPPGSVIDSVDFNLAFVLGRTNLFETFTERYRNTNKTFHKCFALDSEYFHGS